MSQQRVLRSGFWEGFSGFGTTLRTTAIALLFGALVGCYGPLDVSNTESSVALDLSGLIGTLDAPEPGSGWVIDVYLFRTSDVQIAGWNILISSRADSVPIGGERFHRVIVGGIQQFDFEPIGEPFMSGTTTVEGIPKGGPYVMLLQIWLNGSEPEVWRSGPWHITGSAGGDDVLTLQGLQIDAGKTTRVPATQLYDIGNEGYYGLEFADEPEPVWAIPS